MLILSLILTIIIEFAIYAFFVRRNIFDLLFYSVIINSITNPLANLAYIYGIDLFLIEFFVFVVEIFLIEFLLKTGWKKAAVISLVANLASFLVGLLFL